MEEPTKGDWGDGQNLPRLSLVSLVAEGKSRPQQGSMKVTTLSRNSLLITWGKISKALGAKADVAAEDLRDVPEPAT